MSSYPSFSVWPYRLLTFDRHHDTQFNDNVGYIDFPSSAVVWKDPSGITQHRLYFTSADSSTIFLWPMLAVNLIQALANMGTTSPWIDLRQNVIYEATFSSAPGAAWGLGNGGAGLGVARAEDLTYAGGVTAVAWNRGSRVSVFFWDTDSTDIDFAPGEIREIRWQDGIGWNPRPRPNVDFSDFSMTGSLAATTWVDGSGVSQIRLYAKWHALRPGKKEGHRMVEFSAGESGWTRQQEMPNFATAYDRDHNGNFGFQPSLTALAWTYPDGNNVHIRLYTVRCSNNWKGDECGGSGYTHEMEYNTGEGWKDGNDIDR